MLSPKVRQRQSKALKALLLRKNDWKYHEIAKELGYKSPNSIINLIKWYNNYEKNTDKMGNK